MMARDRADVSETGNAQVSRGPGGETTWEQYAGKKKGGNSGGLMILCGGEMGGA